MARSSLTVLSWIWLIILEAAVPRVSSPQIPHNPKISSLLPLSCRSMKKSPAFPGVSFRAVLPVMQGLYQVQSQLDASRGDASSGRRKTRVMNRIHGDHWLRTRCLCTAIWLICLGTSTAIGQSSSTSDATKPDPSPSPVKPAAAPPAAPGSSVEDRLRRMEEAYRRIEEANKKIQGQYDGLLKKYDELNGQLVGAGYRSWSRQFRDHPSGESRRSRRVPGSARSTDQRGCWRAGNGGAYGAWYRFRTGSGRRDATRRACRGWRSSGEPGGNQSAWGRGHRSAGDRGTLLSGRELSTR